MTNGVISTSLGSGRRLQRGVQRLALRHLAADPIVAVVVVLLAATWLTAGIGAANSVEKVLEVVEAAVCVAIGIRLLRERRFGIVLCLALYLAWVLSGAIVSHAPSRWVVTQLKIWGLLPVFATLVATRRGTEQRASVIALTLFVLCGCEFLISVAQLLVVPGAASGGSDLISGSFGGFEGSILGLVVLLTSSVGMAGYLVGARHGKLALIAAGILPLLSAWAFVKYATILLPLVAVVIAVTALILRQTTRLRAAICVLTALVSSGAVVACYAAFSPDSFSALTSPGALGRYISNGTINASSGNQQAEFNGVTILDDRNAWVTTSHLSSHPGFIVGNLNAGDYGVSIFLHTQKIAVSRGQAYRLVVQLLSPKSSQAAQPEIEWLDQGGRVLATSGVGSATPVGPSSRLVTVSLKAVAPTGAVAALPKLWIVNGPTRGSFIYLTSSSFMTSAPSGPPRKPARLAPNSRLHGRPPSPAPRAVAHPHAKPPRPLPRAVARPHGRQHRVLLNELPNPRFAGGRFAGWGYGGVASRPVVYATSTPCGRYAARSVSTGNGQEGFPYTAYSFSSMPRVSPGGVYSAVVLMRTAAAYPGSWRASIYWYDSGGVLLGYSSPAAVRVPSGQWQYVGVHKAIAPTGASYARLIVVRTGASKGQIEEAACATFVQDPNAPLQGATRAILIPRGVQGPGSGGAIPLPGHLTMLRLAAAAISGSFTAELFGKGLGTAGAATTSRSNDQAISPTAAAAYSDAGTVLVDRGWLGVCLAVLLAFVLVALAAKAGRRLAPGAWSTAFTLIVPASILAMGCYALIGDFLQTVSSALTFWVIVALGLAPALAVREAEGQGTRP